MDIINGVLNHTLVHALVYSFPKWPQEAIHSILLLTILVLSWSWKPVYGSYRTHIDHIYISASGKIKLRSRTWPSSIVTATTYALLSTQLQSNKVCAIFMHIKENEPNREWLHLAKGVKHIAKGWPFKSICMWLIWAVHGFTSSVLIYLFDPEDFSNLFMVVIRWSSTFFCQIMLFSVLHVQYHITCNPKIVHPNPNPNHSLKSCSHYPKIKRFSAL